LPQEPIQKPTQETDDATKRSIIARRRHSQTLGAEIPSADMSAGKPKGFDGVDNFFPHAARNDRGYTLASARALRCDPKPEISGSAEIHS
jgi:hypothetical protein